MKKYTQLLAAFFALFLISCEGPAGPAGFDGRDGLNGLDGDDGLDAPLSKVIDIEGTFTVNNDYAITYAFDNSIEVFETDIVLVTLEYSCP